MHLPQFACTSVYAMYSTCQLQPCTCKMDTHSLTHSLTHWLKTACHVQYLSAAAQPRTIDTHSLTHSLTGERQYAMYSTCQLQPSHARWTLSLTHSLTHW